MSAYALPGLFPSLENAYSYNSGSLSADLSFFSAEKSKFGTIDSRHIKSEIDVFVREARVNSAQLIQALTSRDNSASKQNMFRLRNKRRIINPFQSSSNSPHEDSIEFDLDVRVQGRRYSLVRDLPSIHNLRQELVEEVEDRQFFHSQMMEIPKLPLLQDSGLASSAAPSFMLLQSLVQSYAPLIEDWFRKVLCLLPPEESACLTEFLREPMWEPKFEKSLCEINFKLPDKLDAIEELGDSTEEEEEDW